jgi:hypothetical protein
VGHHKPAYGQRRESGNGSPSAKTDDKDKPSASQQNGAEHNLNPPEPRWWGLTRFEIIMSVLTLAGVAIAIFTGLIFLKQLGEMRTDQRAWIGISAAAVGAQFPQDESQLASVPVSLSVFLANIGKTGARIVHSEFVMDYEVNGQAPDFKYDGRVRTQSTNGIIFPSSPPVQVTVPFSQGTPNEINNIKPRYLTASEYKDLRTGQGYMTVYGFATFVDIFGTSHWTHFCTFFVAPNVTVTVTAKSCVDYNDADND